MGPIGSSFSIVPPLFPRGIEPEVMVVRLMGEPGVPPLRARALSIDRRVGGHTTEAAVSGGSVP